MRRAVLLAIRITVMVEIGSTPALALEAKVAEIRAVGPTISASVDLREAFPDKFRQVLQSGAALHLRVQAEMWEDRPLWDRLVRPALVTVFRIVRDPTTAQLAVSDAVGRVLSVAAYPDRLPVIVGVVSSGEVSDTSRYYMRTIATIGTIAERDIEQTGDQVFGRDEATVSLGKVGRFLFHTVLQVTDYLQSVSAEARTGVIQGRDLRRGVRNP